MRPIILITALPDTHLNDEAISIQVSRSWLQGNVAKAKEHLATLERIYLIPSGEYDDLKRCACRESNRKSDSHLLAE